MLTTGNDIQFVDILFGISIIFALFAALLIRHYQKKKEKNPSFRMTQSAIVNLLCVVSIIFFYITFFVYAYIGIADRALSLLEFCFTIIEIILWGFVPYFLYKVNKKIPKTQAPGTLVTDEEL